MTPHRRRRSRQLWPVLLLAALPAPATAPAQVSPRGPAAATVNGQPIFRSDLDSAVASFIRTRGGGESVDEARKQEIRRSILDGLIGTELLHQRARALGIEVPQPEVDEAAGRARGAIGESAFQAQMKDRGLSEADLLAMIRQNLTVQRLIRQSLLDPLTISEAEARAYYDENPSRMQKPEGVDVSHILVGWQESDGPEKGESARRRVEEALAKARAGEDFAALARAYSEDSSAPDGGAIGTIYPGQTHPAFEQAAFKLQAGGISEVVRSPFGFHVIRVAARHPVSTAAFEEVRASIVEHLRQRRSEEAIEKLVGELRAAARIEIF